MFAAQVSNVLLTKILVLHDELIAAESLDKMETNQM